MKLIKRIMRRLGYEPIRPPSPPKELYQYNARLVGGPADGHEKLVLDERRGDISVPVPVFEDCQIVGTLDPVFRTSSLQFDHKIDFHQYVLETLVYRHVAKLEASK